MKPSIYKSYDELPLMLNMKPLSDLLGISDASAYELVQEEDFPPLRIGKRIVVPKEELRRWISAHTKGGRDDRQPEARCEEVFLYAPQRGVRIRTPCV